MPRKYGYARVSTTDQVDALKQQRDALKAAGCAVIREEQASGTTTDGRPELLRMLEFIDTGDTLVVVRLDRLARSMRDLQEIVHQLQQKGAALQVLDHNIDTSTATGKAFLGMLGVFAEFEHGLRLERQRAGIARAKAEGKYRGRKPVDQQKVAEVSRLVAEGVAVGDACKRVGIGRTTYYQNK